MPRNDLQRLRGLGRNRRLLLNYVGYGSIRAYRRDNPEFRNDDRAYNSILNLYNYQVDILVEQRAEERRQRQVQLRSQRNYANSIGRQVDRAINQGANTMLSIPVEADTLGNLRPLLNRLARHSNKKLGLRTNGKFYALNRTTLEKLEKLLDERFVVESEEFESGKEIIQAIEEIGNFNIDVLPLIGAGMVEGGLFPYTHNLDKVDLKRYAIYHKDTNFGDEVNDNNCLITALKCKGIDTEALEQYVKNQYIPQKYLTEIAPKIKHYIIIKKIGSKNLRKYGNPDDPEIVIGLVENHYFLIEETCYTSYAIQNYFKIKDEENWNEIYNSSNKKDKKRFIDTYELINLLVKNKYTHLSYFTGVEIYKMNNYKKYEEDIFKSLEYCDLIHSFKYDKKLREVVEINPEGDLEANEPKVLSKKKRLLGIDFFDFETTTRREDGISVKNSYQDSEGKTIIHRPYILGSTEFGCCFETETCGKRYLNHLTDRYGIMLEDYPDENDDRPYYLLIAHNAGYDFRFLLSYFHTIKTIEKGTGLMMAVCDYYFTKYRSDGTKYTKKLVFEIRDSLKMINMPLSKFGSCFNLEVKKEILPYDLYTEENVAKIDIDLKTCLSYVKEDEQAEYLSNAKRWNCYDGRRKKIDILRYSQEYCMMDCLTLKAGYMKFRELCLEAIDLDILNYISLASMADDYLKIQGCYDGVLKICGIPRAFIQKCVVGGRTMCSENKKHHITDRPLADFDAVSLYPSAMARMEGFLIGKPKIIKTFEPEKYDGYFVCIRVKKVNKRLKFPLCSYLTDKGIRMFSNDLDGRIVYLDKVGLEDWVKYQGGEYEFINGYYYDEGFNPKIKETITYLFQQRLKYKKENNPLQLVFKECMNSSYGKAYMKPIESDDDYIKNADFNKYINRHYNAIKQATELANGKGWKVSVMKRVDKHYNNAQVGVEILSMSKRIMNEVMCLAEDLKLNMFYQDTDSIHLYNDQIEKLSSEYDKQYGKTLIGKGMGQFHTDFDMKGSCGDIVAVESIFLGKKAYVDKLMSKDKDGNTIYDYHIRLKGVPDNSIKYLAQTEYDGNVLQIYKDLFAGKELTFDLIAVKPKFDLKRDMTISSKSKFNRKVRF